MNQLPPPYLFSDPNERLLASVMPGPPPPLAVRARRRLQQASSGGLAPIRRWLRRGVGSTLLLVGLGSFGVGLGAYLGVVTRGARTTVAAETARVLPHETSRLRDSGRAAVLDPIPCATGPAETAPLVDAVSLTRTPAPRRATRADAGPGQKRGAPARRRSTNKHRLSSKPEQRPNRARAAAAVAHRTTGPRAANAAAVRSRQR